MIKSLICLSLILLPLIAVAGGRLGGWRKIENLSDPNVVSLAKYAVEEHNKQSKASLVFVKIVSGEKQVVNGVKYSLKIAAKDGGGATKNYVAVVVERARDDYRSLESFQAA